MMDLDRLVVRLGSLITLLVAASAAYGVIGFVLGFVPGVELEPDQSIPWPTILPPWLLVAPAFAALAVTVVQMPLLVVQRARKREQAARREAEARAWLGGQDARDLETGGAPLLAISAFRAHVRGPRDVELSWNPPLGGVDEVVVSRSLTGFALRPEARDGQELVYSGDETDYRDVGLEDSRAFHYTAFARDAGGRWSAPAWALAVTPALPLHTKLLVSLRISRTLLYPWRSWRS
jgi:hypothetical protein